MREFCKWLFATREEPFDISLFNIWHILYIVIIVGCTLALGYYVSRHGEQLRKRTLRALAYALVIIYLGDFFIQPLFSSDYSMNVDKLPFHICTVLCPIVAFVQFNGKFERFREPVALLSIVAPLMYITYPGTAIGSISPSATR